jgi:hypothetical protein
MGIHIAILNGQQDAQRGSFQPVAAINNLSNFGVDRTAIYYRRARNGWSQA